MEIRFAIIPPAATNARAAALAKKYAGQGRHRFLVDNKKLFPHITLFKVNVSRKNYLPLLVLAKKELRNFKPLNLEIKGFLLSEGGWVGLNVKSSAHLIRLRKVLFEAVKNSGLVTQSKLKQSYRPHITLTRFYKDDFATTVTKGEPLPRESFFARSIGLCLSRQTQVYKIVDEIKLK